MKKRETAMKELKISKETGIFASEVADYLLRKNQLEMAAEQFRLNLEDWLIERNNDRYCFPIGSTIKIIDGRGDLIRAFNETIPVAEDGVTDIPSSKGWSLTKEGKLVCGADGWLIDENRLYILKDGRRVKGDAESLRIGVKDRWGGLSVILGHTLPAKQEVYDTAELFRDYRQTMNDVVYQAFQINICYARGEGETEIKKGAVFYSIGGDETGIPIVVTRIKGKENSPMRDSIGAIPFNEHDKPRVAHNRGLKKLVIAGPHGDERNAQRVIMQTQRYFIENGNVPDNAEFYFIPCLSPTLAFADARGIPYHFWKGGENRKQMPDGPGPYEILEGELSIPELHDKMTSGMRSKIQSQENPTKPTYGVDANRDYYVSLRSSKWFANFILPLTGVDVQAKKGRGNGNCTIFFMHGYDDTKDPLWKQDTPSPRGCVYGQYEVKGTNGYIPLNIKRYIDFMTQSLFGYINSASAYDNYNVAYFYKGDTEEKQYRGEWIRHLYGESGDRNILAFDIELGRTYNEGVRVYGYDAKVVGSGNENERPFFLSMYFVPDELREKRADNLKLKVPIYHTTSFYDFLKNFYDKKAEIDAKRDW